MSDMAQPLRKPIPETRSYSDRIRERVEADDVMGARALVAEALERGESDKDVLAWQRVLAPSKPIRVGGERDIDRTPDLRWLEEHAQDYRGYWVALLGGKLLAHSPSFEEVVSTLKEDKPKHPPLVEYIGYPPEVPGLSEARTYAEKIRLLIEADLVAGARKLLAEALEKGDHGEDLSYWREVLAPAKMIGPVKEQDPDRTPEFEWLKAHGTEYQGEWVALCEDRLLAHSRDLEEVLSSVKDMNPSRRPLLHYIG